MAEDAASALGITSDRLLQLGLVDEVIPEPLGGAHKDPEKVAAQVGDCLAAQLEELSQLTTESLLEERYQRLLSYGEYKD
jgi:acetyl-CoA carboxylase carboxyl transferase subunit alpha